MSVDYVLSIVLYLIWSKHDLKVYFSTLLSVWKPLMDKMCVCELLTISLCYKVTLSSSLYQYQFLVLFFCNMHCFLKRLFLLHYTFSKLYLLCNLSFLVTFKAIFQEKRHVGIQIQFVWDVNDLGKLVLLKYIVSHLLFFTVKSLYLLLKYCRVIHVDHT